MEKEILNNHFANDSIPFVHLDPSLVTGTMGCLSTFFAALVAIFSDHKFKF